MSFKKNKTQKITKVFYLLLSMIMLLILFNNIYFSRDIDSSYSAPDALVWFII